MLRQVSDSLKAAPVTLATMPADMRAELDRRRRHRPHPGLAQGHQQRSRRPVGLQRPGAGRGARRPPARRSPSANPAAPSWAPSSRRASCPSSSSSCCWSLVLRSVHDVLMTLAPLVLTGLADPGDLRGAGPAAELRQCHRPAAAAGHRRRLQHLFRGGLAARPALLPGLQPDAGGDLLAPPPPRRASAPCGCRIHPGTASMGELLMISLVWTLVTTLFLSPALLGPPPRARSERCPATRKSRKFRR